MKQELLTLNGKEYLLDIEQAEKLGLLKEKDNRVRSWKEFVNKHLKSNSFYCHGGTVNQTTAPNSLPEQLTPYEAKALEAFSKLLKLRRDWIGEWEPDWQNGKQKKYVIVCVGFGIRTGIQETYIRSLSFPTQQMATEFLETFRDLIEEAKIFV